MSTKKEPWRSVCVRLAESELLALAREAKSKGKSLRSLMRVLLLNQVAEESTECVPLPPDKDRLIVVIEQLTVARVEAKCARYRTSVEGFVEQVLNEALDDLDTFGPRETAAHARAYPGDTLEWDGNGRDHRMKKRNAA